MRTIATETMTDTTIITRDKSAPMATVANYETVRFNAMKHGILSRLAVLAHEDHAEFDDLLAAPVDEHRPAGMSERHLIEELSTIIWRKRRVLLAEGAKINEGLKSAVNSAASVIKSAATLRMGGANAYEKARRALIPESRDWWDEHVAEKSYPATAEGLAEFIRESPEPICYRTVKEAKFIPAIKAQTLGEGLRARLLEKRNRYETHLDRKFERTLAMLLKLKELRGA